MRKILFSTLILFSFFACSEFSDLEMPESISVRSEAKFALPAGDTTVSLREKLSVTKMQEILNDNIDENASSHPVIYDYNPTQNESDVLQYIIDYPIQKISLSVSDTDSDIDEINFSSKVNLNIQEKVANPLAVENSEPITVPVLNPGAGKSYNLEIPRITLSPRITFSSALLSSGKITLSVAVPAPPPSGITLSITASVYSGSKLLASDSKDCTNGGSILLDMSGCTISSSGMYVLIGGTVKNDGSSESTETYYYSFSVSVDEFKVSKITGLTLTASEIGAISINETKPVSGLSSCLKSAKISQGILSFSCAMPTGWSGIEYDDEDSALSVRQTTEGGLDISKFQNGSGAGYIVSKTADLAGQSVNSSDVKISGNASISLKNATIDFSQGDELTFEGKCKITELSELVVDMSEIVKTISGSIDTGINFSEMLSSFFENDENLMENIKFSGISGFLFVQQPTGNETLNKLSLTASVSANSTTLVDGVITIKSLRDEEMHTLASLADSNSMITENWTDETDSAKQIFSAKVRNGVLDDLLNSHPEELSFSYSLTWSGVDGSSTLTLNGDDLKALKENSSISVSIALVLPFNLIFDDVSDGARDGIITIDDVLALLGNEFDEDLLNRDEDFESEDYTKYSDAIEKMSFDYTLVNTTPLNGTKQNPTDNAAAIKLIFYDEKEILKTTTEASDGTSKTTAGKALETETGEHSLEFSVSEVKEILETYPFIPKVRMEITGADGATVRSFARNSAFGIKGSISLKMNGSVEIWKK